MIASNFIDRITLAIILLLGAGIDGRETNCPLWNELCLVLQLPGDEERPEEEGVWEDVLRWLPATREELCLHEKAVRPAGERTCAILL